MLSNEAIDLQLLLMDVQREVFAEEGERIASIVALVVNMGVVGEGDQWIDGISRAFSRNRWNGVGETAFGFHGRVVVVVIIQGEQSLCCRSG